MSEGRSATAGTGTPVTVTKDDRVALVSINRGDGLNRLDTETMELLRDAALALSTDPDLTAVILHGEGVFSAGVDLGQLAGSKVAPLLGALREQLKLGPALCKAWEDLEPYTIAAIEGFCVGGGAALAAALDYRVVGSSAFFRLPEVPMGMNMSWGALPRLVAQLGPARTKQYVIFGERIESARALTWGLCEEMAPDGATLARAQQIADNLRRLPPLPARMTKRTVNAIAHALSDVASHMDRDQFLLAARSADFAEAVAAFLAKREPTFSGN